MGLMSIEHERWSLERCQLVSVLKAHDWLPDCGGTRCSVQELIHYSQGLRRSLEHRKSHSAPPGASAHREVIACELVRSCDEIEEFVGQGSPVAVEQVQQMVIAQSHRSPLLGLPVDVLADVLGRLRARSVCRIAATCSALRTAVNEGGLWRHLYLRHSELVSGGIQRLQMPTSVWRALCAGLAREQTSRRRAGRPLRSRGRVAKGSDGGAFTAWRCPVANCAEEFAAQFRLLGHLKRHFPDSHRQAVHERQRCKYAPALPSAGPWTCKPCGNTFTFHSAFLAHRGTTSDGDEGSCPTKFMRRAAPCHGVSRSDHDTEHAGGVLPKRNCKQ